MNIDKALQTAFEYFQAGDFEQASLICCEILKAQPDRADVLRLLGIIRYQQGDTDSAIEYTSQSIRSDPAEPYSYFTLGNIFREQGNTGEAIANYQKAIEINPALDDAYYNLGIVLKESGRLDEAITCYRKTIQINPSQADTYNNLGLALQEKGQIKEAEMSFRQAVKIDPDYAYAHSNLGNVLMGERQIDEAITHYQKAIRFNPDLLDAHMNLGNALKEKGLLNDAVTVYRKVLQIDPERSDAYYNLGIVLKENGQPDEAITHYQRALHLNPGHAEAYNNLGLAFRDKGQLKEAMHLFREALRREPDNAVFHWNLSLALLQAGNFEQGWKEYEWRLKVKEFSHRISAEPLWDGSEMAGQTILLQAEQGFGDTIQFIRYASLVAQRSAKVIVSCQNELASLLRTVDGVNHVAGYHEQLPDFDRYCPLLSLPLIFHTTHEGIPAQVPYIRVDSPSVKKWKTKIGVQDSEITIGLVWAGREQRSCSLEIFSPLSHVDSVTFYSLQKGEAAEQAKNPPDGMKLIDYTEDIHDFSDTAALMENLDLVIAVDTAVAHLAGALGKPVWTLLPFVPDWRWLLNRDDSPWYPTMRLFRQPSPGDWQSVIEEVTGELRKIMEKRT
jgi:tetratricopeptide (TPR) repeat protein